MSDQFSTRGRDYPPGHPAGTDEFISAGAVLSGSGPGTGGALGTQARANEGPSQPAAVIPAVDAWTGPTVLIAVNGAPTTEHVVRTAHRLFGDSATYLPVDVSGDPATVILAASYHHVDVVVVGPDQRSWLGRVAGRPDEKDLLEDAGFAVLVVSPSAPRR
jgi:hypothetical protein